MVNVILFVVFFIGFLIFRHLRWFRAYYVKHHDVPVPADGVVGWLTGAMRISDDELEEKRGLDFVAYLLTIKYLFWACIGYCFYAIILIPVHATAGGGLTGISLIGLGNVPDGSGERLRLFERALLTNESTRAAFAAADMVGVVFNSVFAFAVLYALYRRITRLRIRSKSRWQRPENYVVLVRDIPPHLTEEQLFVMFDHVFLGEVAHVRRGYKTPGLWKVRAAVVGAFLFLTRTAPGTAHQDGAEAGGNARHSAEKGQAQDCEAPPTAVSVRPQGGRHPVL